MPANTDYLDAGYTVFSNISLNGSGATVLAGTIQGSLVSSSRTVTGINAVFSQVSSTGTIISDGVIRGSAFSSAGTTKSADVWTSRLSVGGSSSAYTGTQMLAFSYISTLGVAMVVQGSASSETIFVWPAVRPGDWIGVTVGTGVGISSLSSGLVYHSHCTVAGQCNVRISNVSTLVQNQTAQTLSFYRICTV